MGVIYIKDWNGWAPGLENPEDWKSWASGGKKIDVNNNTPSLKHLPPISRRRLSQLSKMILEVGHNLNISEGQYNTILCSQNGEITQQNKMTGNLISSDEVRPSVFSLSVFNTPVSLLSIHEKNFAQATVLLSGENGLITGLVSLISQLQSEPDKDVLIFFSDETLPEDYLSLSDSISYPYAFGCIIGIKTDDRAFKIDYSISNSNSCATDSPKHPLSFLKWLIGETKDTFTVCQDGMIIELNKVRQEK